MSNYDNIDLNNHSKNKYNFINKKILGKGAFSRVYSCKSNDKKNKKKYITKIQLIKDKKYAINEINILNKITKHKQEYIKLYKKSNIVNFYDYFISNDYIYTIYEKCNIDLEKFNIYYLQEYNKQLPMFIIYKIIFSIINGINELNFNNIIHCDIKLDNILILFNYNHINNMEDFFKLLNNTKIDNYEEYILNSFDIKIIDFNKSTFINQICKPTNIQTLYYQAPEIIFNNHNFNETVDIWSVGCIIWWLITSEILFDIFNYNEKYGNLYENFDSDSDSESESEYDSSYNYESDYFENYIYLLKIKYIIGECDKSLLNGSDVGEYFSNNKLLCDSIKLSSFNMLEYLLTKKNNFDENDITKDITFIYEKLLKNIFTYDFHKRSNAKQLLLLQKN